MFSSINSLSRGIGIFKKIIEVHKNIGIIHTQKNLNFCETVFSQSLPPDPQFSEWCLFKYLIDGFFCNAYRPTFQAGLTVAGKCGQPKTAWRFVELFWNAGEVFLFIRLGLLILFCHWTGSLTPPASPQDGWSSRGGTGYFFGCLIVT